MTKLEEENKNISEKDIINFIALGNKPKSKKNIEKFFNIRNTDKKRFYSLLKILLKKGNIIKVKKNLYESTIFIGKKILLEVVKIDNNIFFSKPVKAKNKNLFFEITNDENDVNLDYRSLNIGQIFYGKVYAKDNQDYKVKFLSTKNTNLNDFIYGIIVSKSNKKYLKIDRKFNNLIQVTNEKIFSIKEGELVKALLSKDQKNIKAKIVEIIGKPNLIKNINKYLAEKNGLSFFFAEKLENEAQNLEKIKINNSDRLEITHLNFITIDPSDAKDHDDAIWASKDTDANNIGGWEIIVAIADVSYFVKENSLIDLEAMKRCFSIYFPNYVAPMLPLKLSNKLCSLNIKNKKPVIAVKIKIDKYGNKISYKFFRALIQISMNLNYEEFENAFNSQILPKKFDKIKTLINDIIGSYKSLKISREKRVPLEIISPENKIITNEKEVIDIQQEKVLESNRLVEEFMVTANSCAAEFLIENSANSIFRVHDKPTLSKLYELSLALKEFSINFDYENVVTTSMLNRLLKNNNEEKYSKILNLAILRCQSQAQYSSKNIGHFGLSLDKYTHFTSPIRRYSDILVHRSIIQVLEKNKNLDNRIIDYGEIALHISESDKKVVLIEREINNIYSALFFQSKVGQKFSCYITTIKKFGVFVNIDKYNIEGLIPVRKLGKDYFNYNEDSNYMIGKKTKEKLTVGSKLVVKVKETNILNGNISFERI